ncbi:MAG: peptide deformylase [Chloroflexota bacterium]
MAVRDIVFINDARNSAVLRKRAIKVVDFGPKFQQLVDDMIETMLEAPGVGLAAPQIGVSQRVIVVRLPDDEDSQKEYGENAGVLYVVANPEIVKESREMVDGVEACLSIPGYFGEVDRHEGVTIKGQDRHGENLRIKAKGWLARVFQHEIDHLNGKLFIDIASDVWRQQKDEEPTEETAPASDE